MKIIAITQRINKIEKFKEFRDQIDDRLNLFVDKAGYLPVPIPNFYKSNKKEQNSLLNWLKTINPYGIILSGGDDIGVYKVRDKNEMKIIKWSIKKKTPILGICRGMQIINKFFGGTKVKIKNHVGTRHKIRDRQSISIKKVNSFHSWGFYPNNLAKSLKVKTSADDKTVESFKHKKYKIYGIMWHPEREKIFRKDDLTIMKRIFN